MSEEEKNIFAIDGSIQPNEQGSGNQMNPGIHSGVELKEIKLVTPEEDSANWEQAVDFVFESKITNYLRDGKGNIVTGDDGSKIVISRPGDTSVRREFYSESNFTEKKWTNSLKRMKHIMSKFVPESEAVASGKTFQALIKDIIKRLEGKTEGVKLRLKIVQAASNGRLYNQVPNYTPFIERLDVKISKLQIRDNELKADNPTNFSGLEEGGEIDIPEV